MARALTGTWILCLAFGLTGFAWGQRQPPLQPQPSVLGPILSNPDVQKDLKLSNEQIDKLKAALSKVLEKRKDDLAKLLQMSTEEQQKTMKALIEDSHKAIAGVLDAKQWKRYKQIEWQLSGVGALQDPELLKELKLSDEQKKKLEDIFKDADKKMQDLVKSGATPEKYQSLFKDLDEKANATLNEEQKKNLKDLKGPPLQSSLPSTSSPPKK